VYWIRKKFSELKLVNMQLTTTWIFMMYIKKYMFEKILERISVSKYRDNFILKGGLLLSVIMGIDNRTTRDMDTTIKGLDIDKEHMINILNEILSIDLSDGVKFEIIEISDIREDDEYSGNKYTLYGRIGNTKVKLDIDISTGDIITPRELKYKYPCSFEEKIIVINTYNLSTVFAEKLETVLSRGTANSRMKDYYDLYYFLTNLVDELDYQEINKAIENTFKKRESMNALYDYDEILSNIIESKYINNSWNIYSKNNIYAQNIEIIWAQSHCLKTMSQANK